MKRDLTFSIHPLFWLFAALLGYLWTQSFVGTLIWIVVILVSVTVHELGHALAGLLFKQRVHIQLMMFGGMTTREGPRLSLPKEFILTLNGPLFGYALGGIAYGIMKLWPGAPVVVHAMLWWFVLINIFWSTINLFPVLPLDGGHLLRIVLEGIFGARGTPISLMVGVVLGGLIAVAAFVSGWILVGAVFFLLTFESFRGWMAYRHIVESDRDEDLQQTFKQAQAAMQSGLKEEALSTFEHIRYQTGKGLLYSASTEAAAHLLAESEKDEQAYAYLREVRKRLSSQSLPLLQRLAYKNGDYDTVIEVSKECFQLNPSYGVAWMSALAHAARHEVRPAIGWLECAVREGLPDINQALSDAHLDPIRQDPQFQKFTHSLHT